MHTTHLTAPLVRPFRLRTSTRWCDEDNQSLLNNAIYLTLLEEARWAFFRGLGLIEDQRFPFVLAQCNLRFVAPGRGGVEVEVELATTRLGQSSFEQLYRVSAAGGGALWCEAEALLVAWDPVGRRSCPLQPAFRAALARAAGLE